MGSDQPVGSREEILGMEYGEALAIARPFRILLTRPPQAVCGVGRLRVVGQRQEPQGWCWFLSYSGWLRRGSRD